MNRAISLCVTGALAAVLAAVLAGCAAPGDEKQQQAEAKKQADNRNAKNEACEEVTGSRLKRCAKDGASTGMVSGGAVAPGSGISTPAGLTSK